MIRIAVALLFAALPLAAEEPVALHYASDGTPYMTVDREALRRAAPKDPVQEYKDRLQSEGRTGFDWFDMQKIKVRPKRVAVVPESKLLAQIALPGRLDTTARIPQLHFQFNDRWFYLSTAFDRQNKVYFAFYADSLSDSVLEPEGGRILKGSIPVDLDAATRYEISLHINIFNPNHSSFVYSPADGYPGDEYTLHLDDVMDYIKGAGQPVAFQSGPLYFFYATDADAATKRPAATRTLSFVKEDGRNSKMYTIRDEQLPKNQWVQVDLGGQPALLLRSDDDTLLVQEPN